MNHKETISTAWIQDAVNLCLEKSYLECDLEDGEERIGSLKEDEKKDLVMKNGKETKGNEEYSMMNKGNDNLIMIFNIDQFEYMLNNVKSSFLEGTEKEDNNISENKQTRYLHCLAVKSNPLPSMLKLAVENGFGLECASISEVELSLCDKVKCHPSKIVYDGPCKTINEIKRALSAGVHLNADNFDELDRIIYVREKLIVKSNSIIGVRVNPLVGAGSIETLSVSTVSSKFGIPLTNENKSKILSYFQKFSWLTGLHCHVGSQGCPLSMLAEGAKIIVDLADEIDLLFNSSSASKREKSETESSENENYQITHIDIGGGLPTNFDSDDIDPTFSDYVKVLKVYCPSLFAKNSKRIVMTEFGRAIVAKVGCIVSKIEYIKEVSQEQTKIVNSFGSHENQSENLMRHRIAIIHAGSDLFLRTCYCPKQFPLRVCSLKVLKELKSIFPKVENHNESKDKICKYDIAGPLCFGGDKIARDIILSDDIKPGDYIIIKDTGANCLSLFSKHCSRPSPSVYGYRQGSKDLILLRKGETIEQALSFWS